MLSDPLFYKLLLVGCLWLCFILPVAWPSARAIPGPSTPKPAQPPRKRSHDPQPFAGITHKPHCAACEQAVEPHREPPCAPPPRIIATRGRRRQVATSHQFCPNPDCRYGGWRGLGNISANGHPSGGPWRQLHCSRCGDYFLETHGTIFHGKRVSVDLIVHCHLTHKSATSAKICVKRANLAKICVKISLKKRQKGGGIHGEMPTIAC